MIITERKVDFYFVQRDGKYGAGCSACGAFFTDSKGRKGNDCVHKCIEHAKEAHASTGGLFTAKPGTAVQ